MEIKMEQGILSSLLEEIYTYVLAYCKTLPIEELENHIDEIRDFYRSYDVDSVLNDTDEMYEFIKEIDPFLEVARTLLEERYNSLLNEHINPYYISRLLLEYYLQFYADNKIDKEYFDRLRKDILRQI